MKRSLIETMTDKQWQAIINNDISYDGQFYYAVKTTGIFCRPSCKSRAPKRENVALFMTAEQALSSHYRPCKRCKPTGHRLPDVEWITLVTAYIDNNYMDHLTLGILAEISHGSPFHLQRTFKKVIGITPVVYIQQQRIEHAQRLLRSTDQSITGIGQVVGFANTPYFITLFKKKTGITPTSYRQLQIQNMKGAFNYE